MNILTIYANPNPKSFCHAVLEEFLKGLEEGGHTSEVIDLYAINFDPVFNMYDYAYFMDNTVPMDILEEMNLKGRIIALSGGPISRFLAKMWLKNKETSDIVKMIGKRKPKDVRMHQEKIRWADGLAFISPVYWLNFPAILKGWFERVFTYGFAYSLTSEGWQGDVKGRVPLLKHKKALVMSTTFFKEDDYKHDLKDAMRTVIDSWGLRYPGIQHVDHIYFYAARAVGDKTRNEYLQRAYRLGSDF
jgi:NAD(P)H dehydrogenase (quinone)